MTLILTFCFINFTTIPAKAGLFNIDIVNLGGLTASQSAIFTTAEQTWESLITGTQTSLDINLTIRAIGRNIDGIGGILGSAAPTSGVAGGGFLYATTGEMSFDSADLTNLENNGSLLDVILHEMAHVIGLGSLWSSSAVSFPNGQEVYVNGSGEYTGAWGLAAYQQEFDPLATFIPVELDGGPGTANAHWDEGWAGGPGEIMTGFLNAPTFISNTTIASFADIGYTTVVTHATAIPVPATLLLFGSAFLIMFRRTDRAL